MRRETGRDAIRSCTEEKAQSADLFFKHVLKTEFVRH